MRIACATVLFIILTTCLATPTISAQATHATTVVREPITGENWPHCGLSTELSGFTVLVISTRTTEAGDTTTSATRVTHLSGTDENGLRYISHEAGHSTDRYMTRGGVLRFMEHATSHLGTAISGPDNNAIEHFNFHHMSVDGESVNEKNHFVDKACFDGPR